jgi:glycosyltransferase involved in cell wall biosynthesis
MQKDSNDVIRVGCTEFHGMMAETRQFLPPEVEMSPVRALPKKHRFITSPIVGMLQYYASEEHDIIESIIKPIFTRNIWLLSIANFLEATAFEILNFPVPRFARVRYLRHLLLKNNCKRVIFWSEGGLRTLRDYGGIPEKDRLMEKVEVVYPAVRNFPEQRRSENEETVSFFFSGNIFLKGGVNVIDAFEEIYRLFPKARLLVCYNEKSRQEDAGIPGSMWEEYHRKLSAHPGIDYLGWLPREEYLKVFAKADIFVVPSYSEAFGMSFLEAMGHGLPIISTNISAIPEMIIHGESGLLIDVSQFAMEKMFKGCSVRLLPTDFRDYVTQQIFGHMRHLLESPETRKRLGEAARQRARTLFSFETRGRKMLRIYQDALK